MGKTTYVPGTYKEDEKVGVARDKATGAASAYDTHIANGVGFDATKLNEYMAQYEGRKPFSYDFNTDALYNQYKDKYIKQAKMASADVMGQAAAMNGGYGSSYAQTVGNQAYQAELGKLNDIIPELYQLAYDKYTQEGQDMLNMIALQRGERDFAYGEFNDTANRLSADRTYYQGISDTLSAEDYDRWLDSENIKHTEWRDSVSDEQWAATNAINEAQLKMLEEEHNLKMSEAQKEIENTTYSGKGYTPSGTGYDNGNYTDAQVKAAQKFVGTDADGKWGPVSTATAKAKGYNSLAEVIKAMDNNSGAIPDKVVEGVQKYKTQEAQADYLAKQGIDEETAFKILDEYGVVPLTERTWEMVGNGGWNLFGIDRNAKVSDGTNTYTLAELKKELKNTTKMSNNDINEFLIELQKKLGISEEKGWNPFK